MTGRATIALLQCLGLGGCNKDSPTGPDSGFANVWVAPDALTEYVDAVLVTDVLPYPTIHVEKGQSESFEVALNVRHTISFTYPDSDGNVQSVVRHFTLTTDGQSASYEFTAAGFGGTVDQ
jgi:hypothetical protein